MVHKLMTIVITTAAIGLSGCGNMNNTQKDTLGGAVIGAGVGAGIGALSKGSVGTAAIIGAGVGAVGGALVGASDDKSGD